MILIVRLYIQHNTNTHDCTEIQIEHIMQNISRMVYVFDQLGEQGDVQRAKERCEKRCVGPVHLLVIRGVERLGVVEPYRAFICG